MNKKKTFAIALIIIGVIMMFTSHSIHDKVMEGKGQVAQAQETLDRGNSLFSLTPNTSELRKEITSSAQSKIDEGQKKIQFYEQLSSLLFIGGIVVIVIGIGTFFLAFLKKK
jgi:peptidoglycan hydrolase CwlO-like protein